MTPEQLDEIEKLAEAATPGPWPTTGWVEDPHGIPYGVGKDILDGGEKERIAQAERDTAFIGTMREHALPMVKAVREAREDAAKKNDEAWSWMWVSMDLRAERDEARAEVERLRGAITRFVNQYPWQDGPEIQELKALKGGR